jgi:hypothetical protein
MDTSALKLTVLRAVLYALSLGVGSLAGFLALKGWGTYDAATGLFDPNPIDVKALVAAIGTWVGGSGLALTAVLAGWGAKKAEVPPR